MKARIASLLALTLIATVANAQTSAAKPAAASASRVGFVAFRVLNLQRSLDFYTKVLGMSEQRRIPLDGGVVEVLLGYGDIKSDAGVMLMHDPKRTQPYQLGDGYSRYIAYVPDVKDVAAKLKSAGAQIVRGPERIDSLKISILIARDPDGYAIEFVQQDAGR
jgi:lactoylglutathione lyase